jgi:hypothetical protein
MEGTSRYVPTSAGDRYQTAPVAASGDHAAASRHVRAIEMCPDVGIAVILNVYGASDEDMDGRIRYTVFP